MRKSSPQLLLGLSCVTLGFLVSMAYAADPGNVYQCSGDYGSCTEPMWSPFDKITVECCCDTNADENWHWCDVTLDVFISDTPPYDGYKCYKLTGAGGESTRPCQPAARLSHPWEPAIPSAGCKLP